MCSKIKWFLIFSSVIFLLSSCRVIDPIEFVEIKNITIKQGSVLTVKAEVIFYNPNNLKIKIVHHDLDIFVENRSFGKVDFDQQFVIDKHERFVAPVVFSISYAELLSTGLNLLPKLVKGEFDVKVEGDVNAKVFIFKKTMHFDFTEKVNVNL